MPDKFETALHELGSRILLPWMKRAIKLIHDGNFACAAHGEGQKCCLDIMVED